MPKEKDLGLETILAAKSELGSELSTDLDDDLLETCFEIQKKYQFSHDRTFSTKAMENLIDSRVDKNCDFMEGDGGEIE